MLSLSVAILHRWIKGILLKLKPSFKPFFHLVQMAETNFYGFLDKNGRSEVLLIVCLGVIIKLKSKSVNI